MSEKLVTVATYPFNGPGDVARNHLERHGIQAFLMDAHLNTMNWLYGNAIGWAKLQVPASEAEEAVRLLSEAGQRHRTAVRHGRGTSDLARGNDVDDESSVDLERQIYELRLYVASLYRLLVAKGVATDEEIQQVIQRTDTEDGALDGEFYGDISSGGSPETPSA